MRPAIPAGEKRRIAMKTAAVATSRNTNESAFTPMIHGNAKADAATPAPTPARARGRDECSRAFHADLRSRREVARISIRAASGGADESRNDAYSRASRVRTSSQRTSLLERPSTSPSERGG